MAEALYRVPAAAEQPHQILAPKDLAAVWQTADQNLQALATAQGAPAGFILSEEDRSYPSSPKPIS